MSPTQTMSNVQIDVKNKNDELYVLKAGRQTLSVYTMFLATGFFLQHLFT